MEWETFWLKLTTTWVVIAMVALPAWICTERKIFRDICCVSTGGAVAATVALIWSI